MTEQGIDPNYCDYAATAPMWPEAIAAYAEAAAAYPGNPSSLHDPGKQARDALQTARRRLTDAVGFDDGRLLATSGGTESNNLVLNGFLAAHPDRRALVAEDVHPSVWYATETHRDRVDVLKAGADGRLTAAVVAEQLRPEHGLVSLVHACNETGIAHDVVGVAGLCSRREIACHIDGTQALGHLPVRLDRIECDWYSFSAHKFGGPRGVGGIFLRDGRLTPQLRGGKQEWELRAGTENVAGLLATATALERSLAILETEAERLRGLGRLLVDRVAAAHADAICNSRLDDGLPGLVSLSLAGLQSHPAAMELNLRGFAVSTGSACHADEVLPSRIVLALGRSEEEALGTLRISLGRGSTEAAVRALAEALIDVVAAQRVG